MSYVYFLKNKSTSLKYIGAKYSEKNCNPENFWVDYFTSSKQVKNLIKYYGIDDFKFKILKIFETSHDALLYEKRLIDIAVEKDDYLNLHKTFMGKRTNEKYLKDIKNQKKIAKFYGNLSVKNKTGIFNMSPEERINVSKMGGKAAAIINRKRKTGIFSKDVQKRQHETLKRLKKSAYYDPELKKELCSKGGKNGFFSEKYCLRNNINKEEFSKEQAIRGRKGGKSNKGFKWYNDGVKSFKYTKDKQKELPFDIFIIENNFKKGFINLIKGRIWVNDGVKNYMILKKNLINSNYKLGRLGNKKKYGIKNKKNNKKNR